MYYYSYSFRDAFRPKALGGAANCSAPGAIPRGTARYPSPLWPEGLPTDMDGGPRARDGVVLPGSSSRSSFVTTTTFEGS